MSAAPNEKQAEQLDAWSTLFDVVTAYGTHSPQVVLMLAAIETGMPGLIAEGLRLRAEKDAAHREVLRVRKAEPAPAQPDPAVEWWTEWLDAGGRERVAAWEPSAAVPELDDAGAWYAISPDGFVAGVGATPYDARRSAASFSLGTMVDGKTAANAWDPETGHGDPLSVIFYSDSELTLLFVRGTQPGIAAQVGRRLAGVP